MKELERNISQWRAKLRKHNGFEDPDIEELEDHLRTKIEEKKNQGLSEEEAFNTCMLEDYKNLTQISNQYRSQRSRSSYSNGLLANYLKVGWRSFLRSKAYFAINLIGLLIGLTSVFYIIFYIHYELNYDSFHEQSHEIYRVNTLFERASGKIHYPIIPPAFGPAAEENISEIEESARLRYAYDVLMKHGEQSYYEEKVFFAESSFLELFSFEWKQGNPTGALSEINTVVLTNSMAAKYFGNENPIGKTITYNNEIDVKVIGVIEDVPTNSHFSFDFLISFDTFKPGPGSLEPLTSWRWLGFLTYVKLANDASKTQVEQKMLDLFQEHRNPSNTSVAIRLQPLEEIYLTSVDLSNPQGGLFKVNDPENLVSLSVIAILIIAISFFNYFNITSALVRARSKEIGIRKVFGSSRRKVFVQLGSETLIIVSIAAALSWFALLVFNQNSLINFTNQSVVLALSISLAIIILFTLLSSMLFGSTFSSYSAVSLLKSKLSRPRDKRFSPGGLVLLLQFGISASLIMVSLVVISQLSFFSKKDLGYDQKGVLVAKFRSEEMNARRQTYVESMSRLPAVTAVSFGPALDGSSSGSPLRLSEWPEDQTIQTSYFGVDYAFKDVLNLEIKDGRYFSKKHARDSAASILVNEKLAEMLGGDAIGLKVQFDREYEIIGVFKDFHYKSLHHEIGPMALKMWLGQPRNMLVKYRTNNIGQTLQDMESTWQEVFGDGAFPFDYRFLDEQLQSMYAKEQEFATLLKIFTGLAIFLALLGLFGLSSINIQQKVKQIGIRRVLGAEVQQIAGVVGRRYLITAVVGITLSLPFAFLLMRKWLNNYAYSIDLGIGFPALTLLIVVSITIITLGFQVYRVMTVNPANILRDE